MTYNDDLYHWGIKGMRWGVRRYQNKDGTLTPAGKKRYDDEVAKLKSEKAKIRNAARTKAKMDKLDSLRKEVDEMKKPTKSPSSSTSKPKTSNEQEKKSAKDFSDQELEAIVKRMTLEKRYADLVPKETSKGKKFISGMWDKAVEPALQEVAKSTFKKVLESAVESAMKKDDD